MIRSFLEHKDRTALKISAVYVVAGALWIFFSDNIVDLLAHDRFMLTRLSIAKGWIFIAITAVMLYLLIDRGVRRITASRDYYLKLFNDFPALIWRSGIDGKCDYFNRTWLEFTGRTMEEELGDGWVEGVHPDDVNRCVRTYLAAFTAREPFRMYYRLRRFDGEYRWIADYGRPFHDLDDQFGGYVGSCYDITEERQALKAVEQLNAQLAGKAEELEGLNKALLEANQDLEAFNSTVSHDLRGPLANIKSCADILLDLSSPNSAEVSSYADLITKEAKRMDGLMVSLLAFSSAGRKAITRETFSFTEMAQEVVAHLPLPPDCNVPTFNISEGIMINGDRKLLSLALTNLIGNAWKFSCKRDNPIIEVGARHEGGRTVYCVCDNGVGFDQSQRDKLFEAFHRSHGGEYEGHGIGLATVQRIVRRHGGEIWAEGQVGVGATFCFTVGNRVD